MPATWVELVPGVVEAIVLLAVDDSKPVLASLDQACQPFLALVLTVTVGGVGLAVLEPVDKAPTVSVVVAKANWNVWLTLALTVTWSVVTVAVAKLAESTVVGPEAWVVTVPELELVALDLV